MIRAMIGTLAVLAGFAVVERSVDARTGPPGSCSQTDVHPLLPSGDMLAVRSGPTLFSPEIGALRRDTALILSGGQSGWAHIAIADAPQFDGWVPADQLWVDVEASRALYSQPGPMGRMLVMSDGDAESFRVLGCHGPWLHVINARTGAVWIDRRQSS
ncbi:MAG: hypothetical protein ACT6UX_14050 [Reyranella sp.]